MTTFVALRQSFMGLSPKGQPLVGGFRRETRASMEGLRSQAESQAGSCCDSGGEATLCAQGSRLLFPPCGSSSVGASSLPSHVSEHSPMRAPHERRTVLGCPRPGFETAHSAKQRLTPGVQAYSGKHGPQASSQPRGWW